MNTAKELFENHYGLTYTNPEPIYAGKLRSLARLVKHTKIWKDTPDKSVTTRQRKRAEARRNG